MKYRIRNINQRWFIDYDNLNEIFKLIEIKLESFPFDIFQIEVIN